MSVTQLNPSVIHAWLADYAENINEKAAWLTDLDRQIGDADHGSNMERGMKAVSGLDPASFADSAAYLKKVGMTLVSTVGGAAGPLYGTFFLRIGTALPADGEITAAQWADAFDAGVRGIVQRGRAAVGDKTMVDALAPAVDAFRAAGPDVKAAWEAAAEAADKGRDSTVDLIARKGRASYLGERAIGHQDPGASSVALLIEAAARTLG